MVENDRIVYVAPSYEEIQHEHLEFDNDGQCLVANLHSNVSLMMRIDKLQCTAHDLERLRDDLRESASAAPIDTSGMSDKELMESVPSRYISSLSEQESYLKQLAKEHKERVAAVKKENDDKAAADAEKNAEEEFSRKFLALFGD